MAVTTDGLIAEYCAKKATGTGPGTNSPNVTSWQDLTANNRDGTCDYIDYSANSGWGGTGADDANPYYFVRGGNAGTGGWDSMYFADLAAWDFSTAFSMEMWVYFQTAIGTQTGLFCKGAQGDTTHGYWSAVWTDGSVQFGVYGSSDITVQTTDVLSSGVWSHLVFTATTSAVNVYKDGAAMTGGNATGTWTAASATGHELMLGLHEWATNVAVSRFSTFRIYNKALSLAEVQANYAAGTRAASGDSGATGFTGMVVTRELRG
jgi:hypothetical protein